MAISPTRATVLGRRLFPAFAMRAHQFDTAFVAEPLAQRIAVGGSIVNQMFRGFVENLQPVESGLDQFHLAVVSSGQIDGEGDSIRVDDVNNLGSLATFGIADSVAPFFARANQASAAASVQSMSSRLSSSFRSSNQSPSKIPIRVHSSNRRQHVLGEGKTFGNFDHWQPVISTYKIPSRQAREV